MKKFLENNKPYLNLFSAIVIPTIAVLVSIIAIVISNQDQQPESSQPLISKPGQISIRFHDKIDTPETNYFSDIILHNQGSPIFLENVQSFSFIEVVPKVETDSSCSYLIPVKEDNLVIRDNGQRIGDLAEIEDLIPDFSRFNYDHIKRTVLIKITYQTHNGSTNNEYYALFLGSESSEQMPIGKLMWDRSQKFWLSRLEDGIFVNISYIDLAGSIADHIQNENLCQTIGYPSIGLENILNEHP